MTSTASGGSKRTTWCQAEGNPPDRGDHRARARWRAVYLSRAPPPALPEARRRRPEQQEGSGSHPAEADRRGSSGAEGPTIITDFVDRRGGSSRQTGFTGHTTHENACDRRPQENRCPSHKQIFSTNPPRALGAGRRGRKVPPVPQLREQFN